MERKQKEFALKGYRQMDGLIVKEPYIDWILTGEKTIELRGSDTHKRGTIYLVKSGTGMVYGTIDIINSFEIETVNQYEQLRHRHCVGAERRQIRYKRLWAWELANEVQFDKPKRYIKKKGQQVWIKELKIVEEIG